VSDFVTPDDAPELVQQDATPAAAARTPAGTFYKHIDSQQVTEFVPPNSSRQVWMVRGLEPNSGVVFLSMVNDKAFRGGTYVPAHMQRLGHVIYDESLVPNVAGIAVQQVTDSQNQLVNQLEVTVESTSGNSVGQIVVPYPDPADRAGSVAKFTALVQAEVKLLDANEAS
jgi:hypothetical protein